MSESTMGQVKTDDLISRQAAIDAIDRERKKKHLFNTAEDGLLEARGVINTLPSAQSEIAENLYLCKCYITDKYGLQHEVIHTGDIRRVTGWEI